MIEVWKDIPGYEGRYQVSDLGRVKSLERVQIFYNRFKHCERITPGRVLKQFQDDVGYMHVGLWEGNKVRTFCVHQLVMRAFVGPCPEGQEVRHFPENDKSDNKLTNLCYGTKLENQADRIIQGTHNRGENHYRSSLTGDEVLRIVAGLRRGVKTRFLADEYGVTRKTISAIKQGISWSWLTGISR